MPSSPKKRPRTGSELLGRELKRLRSGRRLRDIVDLTLRPPLAGHVGTLSEAGLSEIESGKTMPSLQTLHSLSIIYRTSLSQLMAYVSEERLAGLESGPATEGEFAARMSACDWLGALRIAIRGERDELDPARSLAWRANRASCLARVGLHSEAVEILTECSESPLLGARQRYVITCNWMSACITAGNLRTASMLAREASSIAESAKVDATELAHLQFLRANVIVDSAWYGIDDDERAVREALRLLTLAEESWSADDAAGRLAISFVRAEAWACLGNALVAARDARVVLEKAGALENGYLQAKACLLLSSLKQALEANEDSTKLLEAGLQAAEASGENDMVFEASFRLFQSLSATRPGSATRHLLRCNEVFPLLVARTPLVREYETTVRARQ